MNHPVYLQVSFAEKDRVKQLGARWDASKRHWYVPAGVALQPFAPWLPVDLMVQGALEHQVGASSEPEISPHHYATADSTGNKGISLTQLMQTLASAVQKAFVNAIWVTAEVTEVHQRQGHWYLSLAESHNGQQLAQVRATLWASRATGLQAKFTQATGAWLSVGQKVLLLCEPALHPRFGLSLEVLDLDPNYTLGEQARKLLQIRAELKAQGLYELNRQQTLPQVWTRVAVLSPAQAAGLGDFQRDADRLHALNLCQFVYLHASFQGAQVISDMQMALGQLLIEHQKQAFDALVIIRGGGAQQDLFYLNEFALARAVSQLPFPVITGIGHERDNTILDEIAHTRCDTPSKVIALIRDQIVQQAQAGLGHWQWIRQRVLLQIAMNQEAQARLIAQINQQVRTQLAQARQSIQHDAYLCDKYTHQHLHQHQQRLGALRQQFFWTAQQTVVQHKQYLRPYPQLIAQSAQTQLAKNTQQLTHYQQMVSAHDPKRLLSAGYVWVASADGNPLHSRAQAEAQSVLQLHFQDGVLRVQPIDQAG